MEITVNNQTEVVEDSLTLKGLVEEKGFSTQGIGIAINDTFIPQSRWAETILCPGDTVVIIKAAYGG